jgi:RNA polymerase sigma factor (sigma-70 family)
MRTQQDKDDFLQLISDNKGIIIKICNTYCSDKRDREDLAQEIIYTLWKGSKTFNPKFKFSTWMYRVALNVAISFYRATKKLNNNISIEATGIDIEDIAVYNPTAEENLHLLQKQITDLKEFDKALMLLYFEEKTYKEISEIIGITETNVATKVSRIKEKLKQNITNLKK